MPLNLGKGDSAVLRGNEKMTYAMFGLGWTPSTAPGVEFDLDASLIARDANGNALEPGVCFYNQTDIGWAKHSGDSRGGEGELDTTGDDERIWIDLMSVPAEVHSIDLLITIYEAGPRKQSFGDIAKGAIRLVSVGRMGDPNGDEKVRIDVTADELFMATGMLFAQLVRKGPTWEYKRVDDPSPKFADLGTALAAQSMPV